MVMERWRPGRGLVRWNPFREFDEMERRLDTLFGRPFFAPAWRRAPGEEMGWTPAIDVFEKEDRFVVKAEIPGVKEEDIDISVSGDTLTIKGERKAETEVKEEDYHYCERCYGSFSRSISIPSSVDPEKIQADYDNGILEVTLPKAPEVKPRKVAVAAKKK